MPGANPHSWIKLKIHNYLCQKCGTGKRNAQDRSGGWFATYHRSDGQIVSSAHVPPCEVGQLTEERLEWLRKRSETAVNREITISVDNHNV